ncbi:S-norcoclaurine synthase 1-like [Panicum miliaceum]|uniref:S-norcoclaurine synthase 1-like n=1 Tax=Panicum miliaceum TaxID=4540 RepID=A0A3L6SFK7_PANMI|nr:S-norcoclaurine synthase 1-like [Panicum miliaceum]
MAHDRARGSLPVANVQELAQTCNRSNGQIPESERYIRAEANTEEVINSYGSTSAIPIIDLSKLCDPQLSPECAKLGSACQQWGFFQGAQLDKTIRS